MLTYQRQTWKLLRVHPLSNLNSIASQGFTIRALLRTKTEQDFQIQIQTLLRYLMRVLAEKDLTLRKARTICRSDQIAAIRDLVKKLTKIWSKKSNLVNSKIMLPHLLYQLLSSAVAKNPNVWRCTVNVLQREQFAVKNAVA